MPGLAQHVIMQVGGEGAAEIVVAEPILSMWLRKLLDFCPELELGSIAHGVAGPHEGSMGVLVEPCPPLFQVGAGLIDLEGDVSEKVSDGVLGGKHGGTPDSFKG